MESPEMKAYWNELVPFYAFKDTGRYKDDIVIGVNGKMWRIKRGENVMVPRKVAEIWRLSQEQDQRTAALIDQETSRYAASIR